MFFTSTSVLTEALKCRSAAFRPLRLGYKTHTFSNSRGASIEGFREGGFREGEGGFRGAMHFLGSALHLHGGISDFFSCGLGFSCFKKLIIWI